MKSIITSGPPRLLALLFGAALCGLVSQSALALGTEAGTSIANLAKLTYTVGTVAQQAICSSSTGNIIGNLDTGASACVHGTNGAGNTAFLVDNKVNVLVEKRDATHTSVTPGTTSQVTTFRVTNLGNFVQDYALTTANLASATSLTLGAVTYTDDFQAGACIVRVDSAASSAGADSYVAATDTAVFIDELARDGTRTVYVVCSIPLIRDPSGALVNGDDAIVSLTATTRLGGAVAADQTVSGNVGAIAAQDTGADVPGTVQIVFADAAGTDDVAPPNGAHSARDVYRVASAIISVSKTSTLICDPFNGNTNPKHIPGAVVQYAISISNAATATATATLSQVVDTLAAASLLFEPRLISGAGATPTTTCTSAGGTQLSATTGFGVIGNAAGVTSGYLAPGLATQATTAGATVAGQLVTIDYPTLAAGAGIIPAALAAGALPPNSAITVYFNVIVQ